MTLTVMAKDPASGRLGVATATGKIAVGAQVPHLKSGLGVIATQGFATSPLYAEEGFRLLQAGSRPEDVVSVLTAADRGRAWRQLVVMDREGRTAGFTGEANEPALGQILAGGLALAGNMLQSEAVLGAMRKGFATEPEQPLAARLLAALAAGEAEGGDKRGSCAAALLVETPAGWLLDLRIDDHERPVEALQALYRRALEPAYQNFRNSLPTPDDPHRH
jgi:uncharacterized Ntn-hydrolase superfamily protein